MSELAVSLLVVDDDRTFAERLARSFERRGLEVTVAHDHEEAVQAARVASPELAVVDLCLPGASGLQVLRDLLKIDPTTRVVVLTGYGSIATAVEAVHMGAANYLQKPADTDEILAAFRPSGAAADGPGDEDADDAGVRSEALTFEPPSLARVEWEHIQRVLNDVDGNVSRAAERLNIHRRTLQRKLRKYPPSR
jgi:two-component system response regulator RegA